MNMDMKYTSLSAICIYDAYVYVCIVRMIWMLIHVYLILFRFHIAVGSSFRLGGVGSNLSKVRGNLSVVSRPE